MLGRRRNAFIAITLILTAMVALWFWTKPKIYRATANVLLTRIGSDATAITEGEIASEIELAWAQTSDFILGSRGRIVAESTQAIEARRAELRTHVDVHQIGKSHVLAVSFTDPSQQVAADATNQLTDLYLQHRHRLFSMPLHLVGIEAEAAMLAGQAEAASKELQDFDVRSQGKVFNTAFRVKSERLAALESRMFEYKASVRGQEEVVRALQKLPSNSSSSGDAAKAEAQLAGMRAQLLELEREFARIEKLETQGGTLASKRQELSRRALLAQERAEALSRDLQQSRIVGMNLQARAISRAEAIQVRDIGLDWWQLVFLGLGILVISWLGSWAVDLFDRPVYSDDEFARMTGASKVSMSDPMPNHVQDPGQDPRQDYSDDH